MKILCPVSVCLSGLMFLAVFAPVQAQCTDGGVVLPVTVPIIVELGLSSAAPGTQWKRCSGTRLP